MWFALLIGRCDFFLICFSLFHFVFFFFKQKTAYEMRISDWSSDVCSSDLRAKGSSDVTVYHGAVEKLKDLETRNPKIQFQLLYNNAKYAEEQYASAIDAMIEGAFLAVVAVFLFLRDWRATFISALAIPLSAIPSFRSEEHTSELQSLMRI